MSQDLPAAPGEHRAAPIVIGVLVTGGALLAEGVLFAAPVGLAVRLLGAWQAFGICSVVYSLGGFALAGWVAASLERRGQAGGRLAGWLAKESTTRRSRAGRSLLRRGRVVGFVVASVLLGGMLTTWLSYALGHRQHLVRTAAASSVIFGVGVSATYAGILGLIVN